MGEPELEARVTAALAALNKTVSEALATKKAPPELRRRKRFRPWDAESLGDRLCSYSAATWFGKLRAVRKEECAARGWTCVGVDRLQCELCQARLDFAKPADKTEADYARAFRRQLRLAHREYCPWRLPGSEERAERLLAEWEAAPPKPQAPPRTEDISGPLVHKRVSAFLDDCLGV